MAGWIRLKVLPPSPLFTLLTVVSPCEQTFYRQHNKTDNNSFLFIPFTCSCHNFRLLLQHESGEQSAISSRGIRHRGNMGNNIRMDKTAYPERVVASTDIYHTIHHSICHATGILADKG